MREDSPRHCRVPDVPAVGEPTPRRELPAGFTVQDERRLGAGMRPRFVFAELDSPAVALAGHQAASWSEVSHLLAYAHLIPAKMAGAQVWCHGSLGQDSHDIARVPVFTVRKDETNRVTCSEPHFEYATERSSGLKWRLYVER